MTSLKIALRQIKKRSLQSALNLTGLAVGFAVFMLIFQHVAFEKNYEIFNPRADQIFRVENRLNRNGDQVLNRAEGLAAFGNYALVNYPEVLDYVKIFNVGAKNNNTITIGETNKQSYSERKIFFATSSFPQVFALNFLDGNGDLSQPNQVIVSETTALKYFGSIDGVVGRQIQFNDDDRREELLNVTGVFKDYNSNSHLEFELAVSFKTLLGDQDNIDRYANAWRRFDFLNYLVLAPQVNTVFLENELSEFGTQAAGLNDDDRGYTYQFVFRPIKEIHLGESIANELKPTNSRVRLTIIMAIGVFILILAWVNFINLTTATAIGRAKETGVRKVLGAVRTQLMRQYMIEAAMKSLLAFLLAFGLYFLGHPIVNQFLPAAQPEFFFLHFDNIIILMIILLTGSLLSSIYPAIVLSAFDPIEVLKGNFKTSKSGVRVRKILVILQSAISIFLMTGLFTIIFQVRYMQEQDLGMNPKQVLVMTRPANFAQNASDGRDAGNLLKNRISGLPGVSSFAASNAVPGREIRWEGRIGSIGSDEADFKAVKEMFVKDAIIETLDLELLSGRSFMNNTADTASIILNESAMEVLGYSDPNQILDLMVSVATNVTRRVVGIIKDYHHDNLKEEILPTIMLTRPNGYEYYLVRMNLDNTGKQLEQIEQAYAEVFPNNPFNYFFLDEHFNANYKTEMNFSKAFSFFSIIAILIAVIGLYGLSAFITMQRKKEIGIRKVVGASSWTILRVLNREFVLLILFASLVATPVAIYWANIWLASFPYRISIGILLVALPSSIILLVSLLSTSIKTITASRLNPINYLRSE